MKTISRYLFSALLMTLTVQFVGCGAADISSAKLYRQKRDYPRAEQLLLHAISEDPANDEAWYLYTVNLFDLRNYERIAEIIDTAMLYSVTHRSELQSVKHNTWIELYNGGLNTFNANPEGKEAQKAAIGYLESARKLAPEQPETYDLLGSIYYSAGDTASAIKTYTEELNQMNTSHQQGSAMGLMLRATPASVERSIGGAPARKQSVHIGGGDSALVYVYPSKQAYIYFERATKAPRDWQLTGWRIGASDDQGMQPMRISTQAYELVANHYYQRGVAALARNDKAAASTEFDQAIPLLMTLQGIDPSNEYASGVIPDIYLRLDRTEKAKQEYERILAERPSKTGYVSYGTLLMKAQDYPGAIAQFEKALAMDPNYESALYNLAASYKNWAAADQKAAAANPKAKAGDFKGELQKSTDYFERLIALNKNDVTVLGNLMENYDILGKKDKAVALLAQVEALKNSEAAGSSEYWEMLGKLYSRANRPADAQDAYKKADQLKQQGH